MLRIGLDFVFQQVRSPGLGALKRLIVIPVDDLFFRSEERRVGKEFISRWSAYH